MDIQINTNRQANRLSDGKTNGLPDEQTNGLIYEHTNRLRDGQTNELLPCLSRKNFLKTWELVLLKANPSAKHLSVSVNMF